MRRFPGLAVIFPGFPLGYLHMNVRKYHFLFLLKIYYDQ